jgi:hypothetical protein
MKEGGEDGVKEQFVILSSGEKFTQKNKIHKTSCLK